MSFEDILKLKEELGGKVYNDAVFGPTKTIETDFKRANKNRFVYRKFLFCFECVYLLFCNVPIE